MEALGYRIWDNLYDRMLSKEEMISDPVIGKGVFVGYDGRVYRVDRQHSSAIRRCSHLIAERSTGRYDSSEFPLKLYENDRVKIKLLMPTEFGNKVTDENGMIEGIIKWEPSRLRFVIHIPNTGDGIDHRWSFSQEPTEIYKLGTIHDPKEEAACQD